MRHRRVECNCSHDGSIGGGSSGNGCSGSNGVASGGCFARVPDGGFLKPPACGGAGVGWFVGAPLTVVPGTVMLTSPTITTYAITCNMSVMLLALRLS